MKRTALHDCTPQPSGGGVVCFLEHVGEDDGRGVAAVETKRRPDIRRARSCARVFCAHPSSEQFVFLTGVALHLYFEDTADCSTLALAMQMSPR